MRELTPYAHRHGNSREYAASSEFTGVRMQDYSYSKDLKATKIKKQTAKRLTKAVKHTTIGKTGNASKCSPCQACGLDSSGGTNKIEY